MSCCVRILLPHLNFDVYNGYILTYPFRKDRYILFYSRSDRIIVVAYIRINLIQIIFAHPLVIRVIKTDSSNRHGPSQTQQRVNDLVMNCPQLWKAEIKRRSV